MRYKFAIARSRSVTLSIFNARRLIKRNKLLRKRVYETLGEMSIFCSRFSPVETKCNTRFQHFRSWKTIFPIRSRGKYNPRASSARITFGSRIFVRARRLHVLHGVKIEHAINQAGSCFANHLFRGIH